VASLVDLSSLAAEASRIGGATILEAGRDRAVTEKGAGDYVTEVDRTSENAIAAFLTNAAPRIPVVGEEYGGSAGGRYWLVDPLDGTTNFVHGFPIVGVSVALVEEGRPMAGAVHAPFLRETYVGARGHGARIERGGSGRAEPLRVSERSPERAVVGTGFPFRHKEVIPRYLRTMNAALGRFEDLRRPGAASLDLAWVASGVFDGFFELSLSPWDVAAGGLLIEEAGGLVTDWDGTDDYLRGDILAGPPTVHAELLVLAAAGYEA
jgi:myo-inositol-1(or 4)-monophosphatase